MLSEVEIAQIGEMAAVIHLIASMLLFDLEFDLEKVALGYKDNSKSSGQLTTDQLITLISELYLIGNIAFLIIASVRLSQAEESKDKNTSLIPTKDIFLGWELTVLGSLLRVIGDLQLEQLGGD